MTKITVSFEIDDSNLKSATDEHLALLWRLAQANPAPYADRAASDVVEHIGWEIIRRWLGTVPPPLYSHQSKAHYKAELTKFAKYVPGGNGDALDPEWHDGTWVLKDDAVGLRP